MELEIENKEVERCKELYTVIPPGSIWDLNGMSCESSLIPLNFLIKRQKSDVDTIIICKNHINF